MPSSTPSRTSQYTSSTSQAPSANPHTFGRPTQHQSSQECTANDQPSNCTWSGATEDQSAVWNLRYPRIPEYQPPLSTKFDQQSTKSSGSLTNQKRAADPAKVSRPDTGINSQTTTTAEQYAGTSFSDFMQQCEAEVKAEDAEAERGVANAAATYHRGTSHTTARSGSSARSATVSAFEQERQGDRNRAGSSLFTAEQAQLSHQQQEDTPTSSSSMHACPTVQYEVPPWAYDGFDVSGRK